MNRTDFDVTFASVYSLVEGEIGAGHSFTFTPNGVSMLPRIIGGKDVAKLSPIIEEPKKNDIIFYRRQNGGFVLHRIVKKPKNGFYTFCGDNQYYLEKGIRREQLIARLSSLTRDGKKIDPSPKWFVFFLPLRRFTIHLKRSLGARIKKFFGRNRCV